MFLSSFFRKRKQQVNTTTEEEDFLSLPKIELDGLKKILQEEDIPFIWIVDTIIKSYPLVKGIDGSYCNWLYNTAYRTAEVNKKDTNIISFNYKSYPNKLNLGCGEDQKQGYLNVDLQPFFKPDLVSDIRNLYMLPSNYYDEIIANDCLEHMPRCDTEVALKEWNRLLRLKGILFLRVPNIVGLLELFTWESKQSIEDQQLLIQILALR